MTLLLITNKLRILTNRIEVFKTLFNIWHRYLHHMFHVISKFLENYFCENVQLASTVSCYHSWRINFNVIVVFLLFYDSLSAATGNNNKLALTIKIAQMHKFALITMKRCCSEEINIPSFVGAVSFLISTFERIPIPLPGNK